MYCSKCGNLLNENGTCSNCDVASTHVTAANPVSSTGTVSQKTSLAKCAWFAPVAVVVCCIIGFVIDHIQGVALSDFSDPFSSATESGYHFITAIIIFVRPVIMLLISYLFFLLSCSKSGKKKSINFSLVFLLPYILYNFASLLSSMANQIFCGLWTEPVSLDIDLSYIGLVTGVVHIIGVIFAAIISYVLCSIYLNKFDSSEEIKSEEKNAIDSSPVITNYPTQENNGYIQQNIQTQKSEKSRGVAAVLCFFLGALGIHRFYVGKIGTGLLWMFTAGLFGIGAFIDFIIIICGSFKDADDRTL